MYFLKIFSTSLISSWILIKLSLKYKLFQPNKEELSQIETRNFLPTMGGIAIFLSLNIFLLNKQIPILLLVNSFALVGLFDDILKLKFKKHNGLQKKYRLILEILFAAVFVLYLFSQDPSRNCIPFLSPLLSNFTIINALWGIFVIVGTANAVNLTDGIDSLASTLSIYCFLFLIIQTNDLFAKFFIAAILGFLFFNWPKAKLIMGDIGALGIGAAIAGLFYQHKLEWFLPFVGIIFVLETVSVILQIFFVRILNRKLFLLAPFHHHLEKKGWKKGYILIFFNFVAILTLILAVYLAK